MLTAFGRLSHPDLRKKVLFTCSGCCWPGTGSVPWSPLPGWTTARSSASSSSCGQLAAKPDQPVQRRCAAEADVFALGVVPYITASIIIQLLVVVIPGWRPEEGGQSGQAKMTQYTRYLTVGLAVLQTTGIVALARTPGRCSRAAPRSCRTPRRGPSS